MASLHHHAAVLLTFGLLAACGGERSRAGAGADTTGAAAVIPDSAARPMTDSAAKPATDTAASTTTPAGDSAKRPSAVAPAASARADTGRKHRAETKATQAAKPPASADTGRTQASESTHTAPAPAPTTPAPSAQQQPDTSQQAEAPLRDAYHQAPRDTVSEAVYDGWKQFNLNCARCHGEDVLGTTIAPHLIMSLKPDGPINTKELFMQTVCAGRPAKGMPAWCALGLGMDKIGDIYLYVKGRSDAKIGPGRPAVKREG